MEINCKRCGSHNLVKSGLTKYKTQLYLCKDCHYHGTMTGGVTVKGKNQGTCQLCSEPAIAKGLCSKHYHQHIIKVRKEKGIQCKMCTKPAITMGFCSTHYQHHLMIQRELAGQTCRFCKCNRPVHANDLCTKHYRVDLRRRNESRLS